MNPSPFPYHPRKNALLRWLLTGTLLSTGAMAAEPGGDIHKVNGRIDVVADQVVGDVTSVNGSIHLQSGVQAGRVRTVNGSITLADGARVQAVTTVNGAIEVARSASAQGELTTTNGSIEVEEGVTVSGALSTVNGGIRCGAGTAINDGISTTNGSIRLRDTQVRQNIVTRNGNVHVLEGSEVMGDVVIKREPRGWLGRQWFGHRTRPELRIDADSRIHGDIHLYREVELNIHPDAQVGNIIEHYRH